MKTLLKSAAALGLVLAVVAAPTAMAQTAPAATPTTGPLVPGLAIANFDAAVANTDAFRAAGQQRPTTYKPVYDQTQARARAIEAELKPLIDRFNADRTAKKPDAVLQPQYQAIQAASGSRQGRNPADDAADRAVRSLCGRTDRRPSWTRPCATR